MGTIKNQLFTLLILSIVLLGLPAFGFDDEDKAELWTAFINGVNRTSSEVAKATPSYVKTSDKYAKGLQSAESLVNIMLDSMPAEKEYMRKTLLNYRQALRSRHKKSIIAWSDEIYRKDQNTKYLTTRRYGRYDQSLTQNEDQILLLNLRNIVIDLRRKIARSKYRNIRHDKEIMQKIKEFDKSIAKTTKHLSQKRLKKLRQLRVAIKTRNKTGIMLYSQDLIDDIAQNRNVASTKD